MKSIIKTKPFNFSINLIEIENYESTIQINKNIGNGIYNNSIKLFNDSEWLNYLFNVLEDDITAGEWAK